MSYQSVGLPTAKKNSNLSSFLDRQSDRNYSDCVKVASLINKSTLAAFQNWSSFKISNKQPCELAPTQTVYEAASTVQSTSSPMKHSDEASFCRDRPSQAPTSLKMDKGGGAYRNVPISSPEFEGLLFKAKCKASARASVSGAGSNSQVNAWSSQANVRHHGSGPFPLIGSHDRGAPGRANEVLETDPSVDYLPLPTPGRLRDHRSVSPAKRAPRADAPALVLPNQTSFGKHRHLKRIFK